MIITKTPLRISFVGGGSDLPSYYREEPGAVVSATIDRFVYVAVNEQFEGRVLAHYRTTEDVAHARDLHHDRMRVCLLSAGLTDSIEVTSMADVPGSTGLGSSSAFTVGLLQALRPGATPERYARRACQIEIDVLHAPIGKQDQYAAAFGGVNQIRFLPDETVEVQSVACDYAALSAHLLLLYTGNIRQCDAGQVLAGQQQGRGDIRELVALTDPFVTALAWGNLAMCGEIMDWAWSIKRQFVGELVDHWYAAALAAGAWGGKLCGAGGGGFMCFLAPPEKHSTIIQALSLRHVPIHLEARGTQVVYADQQSEGWTRSVCG